VRAILQSSDGRASPAATLGLRASDRKLRALLLRPTESDMPRYFFEIDEGRNTLDEEFIDCADLQAAVQHAKRALYQVIVDEVRNVGRSCAHEIFIRSEDDRTVYSGIMTYTVA
jgi:hypothetical protein